MTAPVRSGIHDARRTLASPAPAVILPPPGVPVSGFISPVLRLGHIRELGHWREGGLRPLEVVRAATANGAKTLTEPKGQTPEFGTVRRGMLADLVIVPENPLANFKVLYGSGFVRLNDKTGKVERVGGVNDRLLLLRHRPGQLTLGRWRRGAVRGRLAPPAAGNGERKD